MVLPSGNKKASLAVTLKIYYLSESKSPFEAINCVGVIDSVTGIL